MPNEWQTVLDEIKNNVSEMAYEAYFVRFKFVSNENGILTTSVPNVFIKTQVEGKFHSTVIDAIQSAKINFNELKVIIDGKENKTTVRRAVEILDNNKPVTNIPKQSHMVTRRGFRPTIMVLIQNLD